VLIQVHDSGIGMSPEDRAEFNERLATPSRVEILFSHRIGMSIVSRLSQRHGIRVQLRPSDTGGTTALVALPEEALHAGADPALTTANTKAKRWIGPDGRVLSES
jgi:signal transduction histidine kinase